MEALTKLKEEMLQPSADLVGDLKHLEGDIMILGAGGKMGPDLAILAKRAVDNTGKNNRVIAVSRFSDDLTQRNLDDKRR